MTEFNARRDGYTHRDTRRNLKDSEYLGVVVDPDDPLKKGRCKIRVFEAFEGMDDDDLPWAMPRERHIFAGGKSKGAGNTSYPKKETIVKVKFNNGQLYSPEYWGIETPNLKMTDLIKDDKDYVNHHVLCFDEDERLSVHYTPEQGFWIYHKGSLINIDKKRDIHIVRDETLSEIHWVKDVITIETKKNINLKSTQNITSESSNINSDASISQTHKAGTVFTIEAPMINLKGQVVFSTIPTVMGIPLKLGP